jgi:hypothetical protein
VARELVHLFETAKAKDGLASKYALLFHALHVRAYVWRHELYAKPTLELLANDFKRVRELISEVLTYGNKPDLIKTALVERFIKEFKLLAA